MYKTHKDSLLQAFEFNSQIFVVINISTVNIVIILAPFNSSCAYSASDLISLCSVYSCLYIALSKCPMSYNSFKGKNSFVNRRVM